MTAPGVASRETHGTFAAVKPWWILVAAVLAVWTTGAAAEPKRMNNSPSKTENLTIGGGCFWCLEAVFQRLPGVTKVVSGYAGGTMPNPTYEAVCEGDTGHAEVIQITFDPSVLSHQKLLEVFWAAHDPTAVLEEDTVRHGKVYRKGTAYQGGDVGTQYRSIILFEGEAQKAAAEQSRREAQAQFKKPIATEITALKVFYPAERYHQNYFNLNQNRNPYCSAVISPKLQKLLKKGLINESTTPPTSK